VYKKLLIKNFRGFDEIEFENFSKINLITGKNNVGKTALLEAIFIHMGYNPELSIRTNTFRGLTETKYMLNPWNEAPWDVIFKNFDTTQTIVIKGSFDDETNLVVNLKNIKSNFELKKLSREMLSFQKQKSNSLEIGQIFKAFELYFEKRGAKSKETETGKSYVLLTNEGAIATPSPLAPMLGYFIYTKEKISLIEDSNRYSQLLKKNEGDDLLQALKIIEPNLEKLSIMMESGVPIIHGHLKGGLKPIPIPMMGDGMVRITNIILSMTNAKDGVVLIDEIENGIHYSKIEELWKTIGEISRRLNVQLFATTHSSECIESAFDASEHSNLPDFRVFRLDRINDKIVVTSYNERTAKSSINMGLELR
jgi:AAA15 family ATPase/GTPase